MAPPLLSCYRFFLWHARKAGKGYQGQKDTPRPLKISGTDIHGMFSSFGVFCLEKKMNEKRKGDRPCIRVFPWNWQAEH